MTEGIDIGALESLAATWKPPTIVALNTLPKGDMPGDKVCIGIEHIIKAQAIFPRLLRLIAEPLRARGRAVASVFGGSGVGKSETSSLLAYFLNCSGLGAYIVSGDNYPRRRPEDNDRERLLTFRESGVKGLVASGEYTEARNEELRELQELGRDADPSLALERPWLAAYQSAGRRGLGEFLGSPREIDFEELSRIIARFKTGDPVLTMKRMGRAERELRYEAVDVSRAHVLLLEWTHGNSGHLRGVDLPILLNSSPAETLEHRRARGRDNHPDSPFTAMVLEIEQRQITAQASKAALIVGKGGAIE
ncbi:MAG: hypothetical protein Q8M76_05385 [Spirochaetaceae bacterium]|nr:hypothetical protein [Spirochaetaceae bacterium]